MTTPTPARKDYFGILGVPPGTPALLIKRAYRHLARRYHPDVNASPAAVARFREVREAYEVLSDPFKRAEALSWYRKPLRRSVPPEVNSEPVLKWRKQYHDQDRGANFGCAFVLIRSICLRCLYPGR